MGAIGGAWGGDRRELRKRGGRQHREVGLRRGGGHGEERVRKRHLQRDGQRRGARRGGGRLGGSGGARLRGGDGVVVIDVELLDVAPAVGRVGVVVVVFEKDVGVDDEVGVGARRGGDEVHGGRAGRQATAHGQRACVGRRCAREGGGGELW